jgi:hypothetical protein
VADVRDFVFCVGQLDDNSYVALSESEPVFCFYTTTKDEALDLAIDTFADYLRRFKNEVRKAHLRPVGEVPVRHLSQKTAYALELA